MAAKIEREKRREARRVARIKIDRAFYSVVDEIRESYNATTQDAYLLTLQAMSDVISRQILYMEDYEEKEPEHE